MGITKKTASDIQPGQIIRANVENQAIGRVVLAKEYRDVFVRFTVGHLGYLRDESRRTSVVEYHADDLVDVTESPDLTPAQLHAEELEKRLWSIVDDADQGNFIDLNGARALLAKIKPPEPPTLAETLEQLSKIVERGCGYPAGQEILDRARRAGLLP